MSQIGGQASAIPRPVIKEGVKNMNKNVGQTERVIRIVAGLGLLGLAAMGQYTPWTWLGVVPLLTGLIGWCPPYAIFGINTCKTR